MSYLKEMAEQGYNPESIGPFHRNMLPYLACSLNIGLDDLIVDVGSAQGHCVIPLKNTGYNNIAVIDIDPYNFDLFTKHYQFKCFKCDVERERFPSSVKGARLVLGFHLIEHLHDPLFFLHESYQILDEGGVIALVTPNWRKQYRTFYRDPTHVHPYDKESITRLLRMVGFQGVYTCAWGSAYGIGKLQAYRWLPLLGMIGKDLLAIGWKK